VELGHNGVMLHILNIYNSLSGQQEQSML